MKKETPFSPANTLTRRQKQDNFNAYLQLYLGIFLIVLMVVHLFLVFRNLL